MKSQKHLFSLDPAVHYLNCAYKGPMLKSSEQAAISALWRERNPMSISQEDFFLGAQEVQFQFSKLVNCSASQVAMIPSSSYGFSTALTNISFRQGQHALILKDEFPSGCFSVKSWCDKHGAELKVVAPDDEGVQQGRSWHVNILNEINASTRVVLMSSVHWMNGLKFDLEKIGRRCKEVGAVFIVDGTQSVGVAEMDVKRFHIDALICPAYKWLLGPYGLGVSYFGPVFDSGKPLEESWLNRKNSEDFSTLTNYEMEYRSGAARYNVGEKSNFILIPMLVEALKQINQWQVSEMELYCKKLVMPLYEYLESNQVKIEEAEYRSTHILGIKVPQHVDQELLRTLLKENKISLSNRGSYLRISINVFNDTDDIEALIAVFEKCGFSK